MIRTLFKKRVDSKRGNKLVLLLTSVLTWSMAVSPAAVSWGQVTGPAPAGLPAVTGISPAEGVNDGVVSGVTIQGQGFAAGMKAQLVGGGTVIPGTNLQLIDASQVKADFDLTGVAAGSWDVVVEVPVTKEGTSLPAGLSAADMGGAWNAREPLVDLSGNNNTLINNNAQNWRTNPLRDAGWSGRPRCSRRC